MNIRSVLPSGIRICWPVLLFFGAFLWLGLSIYTDFGVSWDEFIQRIYGHATLRYITGVDDIMARLMIRHYGPAFEILLAWLEQVLRLTDLQDVYFMRHLVNFLLYYAAVFFFYLLCRSLFGSWQWGLLGSAFLILSPRIFAHAFYNSKDLPFMCMFIISAYTFFRLLEKRTVLSVLWHSLSTALLIDIRIMGIMMPVFTLFFMTTDYLGDPVPKKDGRRRAGLAALYVLLSTGLTILFWPALWSNPVRGFVQAFGNLGQHPVDPQLLFMGRMVDGNALPWFYGPVWLAVTTPLLYLGLFAVGLFVIGWRLRRWNYSQLRESLFYAMWFFGPLVAVVLFQSVLYDAWRQLFFIYPAFLLIALQGLEVIWKRMGRMKPGRCRTILSWGVIGVVSLSVVDVALAMRRLHPYENLYFNRLAGRDMSEIKDRFVLDYWGLSYRKGLQYIVDHDSTRRIPVYAENSPGKSNAHLLDVEDRQRLVFVDHPRDASYFLTNYRDLDRSFRPGQSFFEILIDDISIMSVFRLR